jgi:hypothetical protein
MRKEILLCFFLVTLLLKGIGQTTFKTPSFEISVSKTGMITALQESSTGINYLAKGQSASLLQIKIDTGWLQPARAVFNEKTKVLRLHYPARNVQVDVKIITSPAHISFKIISATEKDKIKAVCWGPFPTTIGKTIGEVVGVVRNDTYAIGLQALNAKTIGGILGNEGGSDDSRGNTAVAQSYGSSLQAYSLNRDRVRRLSVWGQKYPDMEVLPIAGETVLGSGIALFGCPENEVLERIGKIELAEGLPHPEINGVWHKMSPETGRAYLIADFNEQNIDEMLAYTKQAGLMSLYHEGPFQSWGHFILDSVRFPNGIAGMKKCVDKAAALGLRIGVHTLTTFINTNDPYVSPVPDKRLAVTGTTQLAGDIDAVATSIPVLSNSCFLNLKQSTLHAVRIGDEVIRFREVSANPPYFLLDCQRGAFGTRPSSHSKNETANMLMDYPYNTLFPNFSLQQEIAGNMAAFFNETGVSHMDFDGHEGAMSSGEGDYAVQAFAEKVFRDTKHTLVNGTSRSSHYYWHISHYWNWGEPWYGGFRESQGDYRLENQPFLERNYMPNMLGWFLLSSTTGLEDIEWMMARAAGFHAGFALVARYNSLKENPLTDQLLQQIKIWQEASENGFFTKEQIARLKDPVNDFHLEKDEQGWKLYPFRKYNFQHEKQMVQPGQPSFSTFSFEHTEADQPLNFTLTFLGKAGTVTNPVLELDNYARIEIPGVFDAGSSIVGDGKTVKLYNSKGKYLKEILVSQSIPTLNKGTHTLKYDCTFSGGDDYPVTRIVIKTIGKAELIIK